MFFTCCKDGDSQSRRLCSSELRSRDMERIRWGMTFGDVSDEIIDERVKEFAESYADGCAPPRSTTLPTVIDVFRGRHRHADEIIAAALRAYRDGT